MDACIDLFLPAVPVHPHLEVRQDMFHWGGVDHPQGPEYYQWGPHVKLVQGPVKAWPRRVMPAGVHMEVENYAKLTVPDDGVFEMFEADASGDEVDWEGRPLQSLLRELLSPKLNWVAALKMQWDSFSEVHQGDAEFFLERLRTSLMRDGDRVGFCVFHSVSSEARS